MTYKIRLSKYNPSIRYTEATTWISMGDIGRSFDDGLLDRAEYLRVEQAYIDSLRDLSSNAGSPQMRLSEIVVIVDGSDSTLALESGKWVTAEVALEVCRLNLREEISCRLDSESFYVHFGFDYYVYVGGAHLQQSTVEKLEARGLFVEQDMLPPSMDE